MKRILPFFLALGLVLPDVSPALASEVADPTQTAVQIRQNPRTGENYVSIVSSQAPEARVIYYGDQSRYARPDYRMLDRKVKPRDVGYEGPSSSRTKVYALAAALATTGVLAGTMIPVTAATGAGAGSAAGYAAAGAGVTAGTLSASWLATRPDPEKDNHTQTSSVRVIRPLPVTSDA